MTIRNRYVIAYCYPTSPNAKTLGVYHQGGHYIEQRTLREDGLWSAPFIATGSEGDVFDRADHPDLLALLAEYQQCTRLVLDWYGKLRPARDGDHHVSDNLTR